MFSRPWLTLLRRHVLIHRRAFAFGLTVAAVLLGWSAFVSRPSALTVTSPAARVVATPAPRAGFVRMPVRFADGEMAALLHPGQRIELWATDPRSQHSRIVAPDAGVVEVPSPSSSVVTSGRVSRLVVVEVRIAEVEKVTMSALNGVLTYALDQ